LLTEFDSQAFSSYISPAKIKVCQENRE